MSQETQKERLIRIMGTFDLATGHADTFDELLDSLESELRDVLGHYRAAVKEHLTQEPVAMLERTPRLGILRVTYEDAVTELHEGLYPLYVKPQIEVGCAECGVNGGHALYCVACAEKFVGGYKDNGVPTVKTELEQVSPDTPPQRTEQEPVAWLEPEWREKICPEVGYEVTMTDDHPRDLCWIPLYPRPPQRTWVGLTDEEIDKAWRSVDYTVSWDQHRIDIAQAIEAKLKEKNT
jgi:hypothetical protein